jgi:membrane protein implicated in regulation of membrane protease activity
MLMSSSDAARPVRLHALTYHDDGDDVVVGRIDIDSYGVFPPDGAALLRKLADGTSLDDSARWYADTYGEQVDVEEFLGVLAELDFLVADDQEETSPKPLRWQRSGRWAFSRTAWVCYAGVVGAAIAVMIEHPRLVPHTANLFFTQYVTLLAFTIFVGQIPFIMIHEAFHALAGRRLGLRSTMRIGRRLNFVVVETSLDGLVVVPRRQRYLPILAGMTADLLIIGALTLVAAALLRPDGSLPVVGGACLALAFATLLRFVWQFYFYLKTDVYALVVTVLGGQDLQAAARRILRNRFRRLIGRTTLDESGLHPRDREIGRWYSWLMLAGYTFSIATLVTVGLPAAWRTVSIAVGRLAGEHSWHETADSIVFLTLSVSQFVIIGVLAVRSRMRARPVAPSHLTT